MKRLTAITPGVALALIVALAIWVLPQGHDDFTQVLWPAARAREPYAPGCHFWYPAWSLYLLKCVAWLPPHVGLVLVWLCSLGLLLICCQRWGTPGLLVLCAPPFLWGMIWGEPFEALILVGLTLASTGREGLGLMLLMVKPQLGLVPGLVALARKPRAALPAIAVAAGITALDWALTGRLWLIPYWQAMTAAEDFALWNAGPWRVFGVFSLLWLPPGLWMLLSQKDEHRRLFVAYALGLLLSPYWAIYSLWPLVAMAGAWREKVTLAIGKHSFGSSD
jgi:hypothetical protein